MVPWEPALNFWGFLLYAGCSIVRIPAGRRCRAPFSRCQAAAVGRGPVHRRHSRRRNEVLQISCTAINRSMVAHEDSEVPLQLQEGFAAIPQFLSAFYRFTRPHTMLGTFISVTSVSALAVVRSHVDHYQSQCAGRLVMRHASSWHASYQDLQHSCKARQESVSTCL